MAYEPDFPVAAAPDVNGGTGWGWLQDIASYGLKAAIDKEYKQPFQVQGDQTLATDAYGRLYVRGAPTTTLPANLSGALPWLVGGALLVGVLAFVLKD